MLLLGDLFPLSTGSNTITVIVLISVLLYRLFQHQRRLYLRYL